MKSSVENAILSLNSELGALDSSTSALERISNPRFTKQPVEISERLIGTDKQATLDDGQFTGPSIGTSERWTRKFVTGTPDNDRLVGDSRNDELIGYSGNDSLVGGSGDDRLYGYNDNDTLQGGSGQDTLWGGDGNDVLMAGKGKDFFGLEAGIGIDAIKDYQDGEDKIVITNGNLFGTGTTLNKVSVSQSGSAVVVWYGNDPLARIANTKVAQFNQSDFINGQSNFAGNG